MGGVPGEPASIASWLEGRRPEPPDDLAAWIERRIPPGSAGRPGDPEVRQALLEGGRAALAAAASRLGRERASAFELLVADALVTYACEAALDEEEPVEALERVLEVGSGR